MKRERKWKFTAVVALMALVFTAVFGMFGKDKVEAGGELTGDNLAAAQLIAGSTSQTTTITDVKQILSKFGVVTFGDLYVYSADTEGAIAVGGDLQVLDGVTYSVGAHSSIGIAALINGTVKGGSCNFNTKPVALGVDTALAGAYTHKYIVGDNKVIDFAALKTSVQSLGAAMAAKSTSGATVGAGTIWGGTPVLEVRYAGTETDVYVNLSNSDLTTMASAKKINFKVPAGARVIMTYTGTQTVTMPKEAYFNEQQVNQDTSSSDIANNKRVLYNFTNTTKVQVDSLNTGTIMAPKATGESLTSGGHISGQFIFNVFKPQAEVGARSPFEFPSLTVNPAGGSSTSTPTPTPTPTRTPATTTPGTTTPGATTPATTTPTNTKTPTKGGIEVTVTEDDGKTPIPHASVEVSKKGGKVVVVTKTNKDGKLVVKNLTPGEYSIKVTSVPSGYSIPKKTVSVNVAGGKVTKKKFMLTTSTTKDGDNDSNGNSQSSSSDKVVKTGDDFNGMIPAVAMLISGLMMIAGGTIAVKRKRQR